MSESELFEVNWGGWLIVLAIVAVCVVALAICIYNGYKDTMDA